MVKKIAENFNRLSRVHQRYRQTDGRWHIANVNVSSRPLMTRTQLLTDDYKATFLLHTSNEYITKDDSAHGSGQSGAVVTGVCLAIVIWLGLYQVQVCVFA